MPSNNSDETAREGIAKGLLKVSGLGVVGISIVALWGACRVGAEQFAATTTLIFNALLPLFGTWVGTVTAYYFSKTNFEAANKSVKDLVQMTVEQRLEKLKVDENMLKKSGVAALVIPVGGTDASITLEAIRAKLTQDITRLPILDDRGAVKYLFHQSIVYKFIAEHSILQAAAQKPLDIKALTLADLVSTADLKAAATALACVASGATVAEAKARMEQISGCQDVIITQGGQLNEPMLGWLMNVEIGRLAKA